MSYTVQVQRFDSISDQEPHCQSYAVDLRPANTVLDALLLIWEEQDRTLSFRRSCRSGICGSCAVMVNGRPRLACQTSLQEAGSGPGAVLQVAPLEHFPVLKDLVVDLDPFLNSLQAALPWLLLRPDYDGLMAPEIAHRVEGPAKCILCGLCEAELPRRAGAPTGPAGWVKAYRFALDNRDALGLVRLRVAADLGLVPGEALARLAAVCPKRISLSE